jgi:hypothetical protein
MKVNENRKGAAAAANKNVKKLLKIWPQIITFFIFYACRNNWWSK